MRLRYKVEKWTEMTEFGQDIQHTEEPVLQYSEDPQLEGEERVWTDVPTEYVED